MMVCDCEETIKASHVVGHPLLEACNAESPREYGSAAAGPDSVDTLLSQQVCHWRASDKW
jgi:hypothetical protein